MEYISTSAHANELDVKWADLLDTWKAPGWIDRKNDKCVYTGLAKQKGVQTRNNPKFGEFVVSPEHISIEYGHQNIYELAISMTRKLLFLLAMCALWGVSHSQTFQMVRGFGGLGYDVGTDVEVDSQGNIFLAGFFSSDVWFGDVLLTTNGCSDLYLAKLNSEGVVLWASSFGGGICDYSVGLCIDDEDNVYLAGKFQISVELGEEVLNSDGEGDVFIAKFNDEGNDIWARKFGGEGDESCGELKFHDDHLFMSGYYGEEAHYGDIIVEGEGFENCMLMKLNKEGEAIWIKTGGGLDSDQGRNFDFDQEHNIYLSGQFAETATFGNFQATAYSGDDVFICKYNEDGEEQWLKGFGGIYSDQSGELTVDRNGNIYFTGNVRGNILFGEDTVNFIGDLTILKFDRDGNYLWNRQDECTWQGNWGQVVIDRDDQIFLSGKFSEEVIIDGDTLSGNSGYYKSLFAQMTEDGELIWYKHSLFGNCDTGPMRLYNDSTLIMTGRYDGNVDFDDIILDYFGPPDIYLATMSKNNPIEPINENAFLVYPNPACQSFTIKLENALPREISVYTTTGALVYRAMIVDSIFLMDVRAWSDGLYLVNIMGEDYQRVVKLLKN